jgi:hypothetical protein
MPINYLPRVIEDTFEQGDAVSMAFTSAALTLRILHCAIYYALASHVSQRATRFILSRSSGNDDLHQGLIQAG